MQFLKELIPGNHSIQDFTNVILRFQNEDSCKSIIVLTAAGTKIDKNEYDSVLNNLSIKILGSIYPEIIFEGQRLSEGTIIIGLPVEIESIIVDYPNDENRISEDINKHFGHKNPENNTVFIFLDSFIPDKSTIFECLYNAFGTLPNYIGGGGGSLDFIQFPCIYSNSGILEGKAVIGFADITSQIGVAHGWDAISEPLKVTESDNNRIISLNWRPALEVYMEILSTHSGMDINENNVEEMFKSYPFGIAKLNAEMIVRDPYKKQDKHIFTLDVIEKGSHVTIMYGNLNSLLAGAKKANYLAFKSKENVKNQEMMIIDCISRVLFMQDKFQIELNELDPDSRGFGALTLGEIANNGDSYLEIYNKTAVVCAFDDQ